MTLLKLGIYWILLNYYCVKASPLTLEQRVQQLEQNNMEMKESFEIQVRNFEVKVTRLEEKVKEQALRYFNSLSEQRTSAQKDESMDSKESLETRVTELEAKVENQEQQLYNLTEQLTTAENELTLLKNESSEYKTNQKTIYRTCHEARAADSTLKSGMHWIDPDGKSVGDDPIRVHCNMTTGATSILHDSESETDVGRCAKRGCYSKEIKYDVTSTRQIAALVELSTECHQSIKYDCISAPLNFNGVAFSWWNDWNGIARYFWSGSNSSVQQSVCQCGIDGDCFDDFLSCNCDSVLPTQLSDIGIITDKTILPITRLNFGRIVMAGSSGVHTLGRFECTGAAMNLPLTGKAVVSAMPKSCADLWRIGHTLTGLYSVMGTKQVESLYCDFTKRPTDSGFETKIGYVDVKPVYFYVQKNISFSTSNVPIPFQVERLNVGGAMNLTSGIFTVPRSGHYFFSLSGIADSSISVGLYVNNNRIGTGHSTANSQTLTLQSALHLNEGEKVSVQKFSGSGNLYDDSNRYTHFAGWLMGEDF